MYRSEIVKDHYMLGGREMTRDLRLIRDPFFRPLYDGHERDLKMDIIDSEEEYLLYVDLAGVKKENVSLFFNKENILEIEVKQDLEENEDARYLRRERRALNSKRRIAFDRVKEEEVDAKLENGVLEIRIPKANVGLKERTIEIK